AGPGELLDHRQGLGQRGPGAAVALRVGDAEEAEFAQAEPLFDRDRLPLDVQLLGDRSVHLTGDLRSQFADLRVLIDGSGRHGAVPFRSWLIIILDFSIQLPPGQQPPHGDRPRGHSPAVRNTGHRTRPSTRPPLRNPRPATPGRAPAATPLTSETILP